MPLGWYLAQGLVPLSASSSDDEDGPCELPDGRLVCGPHGLVCCGKCCVDYSFMDDVLSHKGEDEDGDSPVPEAAEDLSGPGPRLRRGTGRVFATKFVPPSASITPQELFSSKMVNMLVARPTFRDDTGKLLIRADGACLNNGQPNPKAGWAFWHGFGPSGQQLVVSGCLEKKGPFGDDSMQTSNRAELRAVIAALRFRHWPAHFHTVVIATDSAYTVEGSTKWAKTWVKHGWTSSGGVAVKNRDLWEALLGEIERRKEDGTTVEFWRIPREWNTVADAAAKAAAAEKDAPDKWCDVFGVDC